MFEAHELNPMLAIALIFVAGYPAGLLVRRFGLPAITGNILAGALLGPSGFGVLDRTVAHDLEPLSVFAMGMITVVIGGHLSYRRLHNAKKRILSVTLLEVFLVSSFVTVGVLLMGAPWQAAVLLGAIAVETSPATVLAVVREEKAKGLLVKTLLATVALDNVLCIVFFSVALALVVHMSDFTGGMSVWRAIYVPVVDIALAGGLGVVLGVVLLKLVRRWRFEPFTGLLIGILLATGAAQYLQVSPLLATLALGIILGNSGRETENLIVSVEHLQPILLTCFFTLAGVDIDLSKFQTMGLLGAVYFVARAAGKIGGGAFGAQIGVDIPRIRNNISTAMLPHAGIAIGLLVLIQANPDLKPELVSTITNVVLAAVLVNEIIGPPLARKSITRSGEAGKDRRRIVEFLEEEHIYNPLEAEDKWDAIRKLANFLIRSHGLKDISVEELIASVEERERHFSTAIGKGIALPHARLSGGPEIMGVMGICREGVDFDAPDGEPVRLIILVATPEEHEKLHLDVMATVSRMMSDPEVRMKLFSAQNAAEAWEAIEIESEQAYNYFLED